NGIIKAQDIIVIYWRLLGKQIPGATSVYNKVFFRGKVVQVIDYTPFYIKSVVPFSADYKQPDLRFGTFIYFKLVVIIESIQPEIFGHLMIKYPVIHDEAGIIVFFSCIHGYPQFLPDAGHFEEFFLITADYIDF